MSVEIKHQHSFSFGRSKSFFVKDRKRILDSEAVVSAPANVVRMIHVAWDEQLHAFTGVPDVWRDKIPQCINPMSTENLPEYLSPRYQEHKRSESLCLPARSSEAPAPAPPPAAPTRCRSPGRSKISVKDYMSRLGFADLDRQYDVSSLRESLLLKLSLEPGGGSALVRMPQVIKLKVLSYLDGGSLSSCASTCTELSQVIENRSLWRALVLRKNTQQRTLYSTVRQPDSDWKKTYMTMGRLDKEPSHRQSSRGQVTIGAHTC